MKYSIVFSFAMSLVLTLFFDVNTASARCSANTRCIGSFLDNNNDVSGGDVSGDYHSYQRSRPFNPRRSFEISPLEACEKRISVHDRNTTSPDHLNIEFAAVEADQIRREAIERCVSHVVERRQNRRNGIIQNCQQYQSTIENECFLPRQRIATQKTETTGKLDVLRSELEDLETKIQASLTSLIEAQENRSGTVEGLIELAQNYERFLNLYTEKEAQLVELQAEYRTLNEESQRLQPTCDNVATRYSELCVSQDDVVVEHIQSKTGVYFEARMEAAVEGKDSTILVEAAEKVIESAGQRSQTVIDLENSASSSYRESNSQSKTHLTTSQALLQAYAAALGAGREDTDTGRTHDDSSDDPQKRESDQGGRNVADGPQPLNRGGGGPPSTVAQAPSDGAGYGGNGSNGVNEISKGGNSPSPAMGKTGSGFSFPSLGNLFSGNTNSGNSDMPSRSGTHRTGSASDYNPSYGYANDRMSGPSGQNNYRNPGTPGGEGTPSSRSPSMNMYGSSSFGHNGAATGSNGGFYPNTSSHSDNDERSTTSKTTRRHANKQVFSSRNENNGSQARLQNASQNLQARLAQLKKERKLASVDAFDPDKYVPKTAAERRALARASGKMGGHFKSKEWPKDIYKHEAGTTTDVFDYMNRQFTIQFKTSTK